MRSIMFAIKAEVCDLSAEIFAFRAQKTMYGGKHIAKGYTLFVFASENEGGPGLIATHEKVIAQIGTEPLKFDPTEIDLTNRWSQPLADVKSTVDAE
jgi:hypothetical protein